jgi:hypothetical protein
LSLNSTWNYFIEVNVSGDFNSRFPESSNKGTKDYYYGNGQPSIIYQGEIEAKQGAHIVPVLIGRTPQTEPIGHLIQNMDGITSARHLISDIGASYAGPCAPVMRR